MRNQPPLNTQPELLILRQPRSNVGIKGQTFITITTNSLQYNCKNRPDKDLVLATAGYFSGGELTTATNGRAEMRPIFWPDCY